MCVSHPAWTLASSQQLLKLNSESLGVWSLKKLVFAEIFSGPETCRQGREPWGKRNSRGPFPLTTNVSLMALSF